VSDKVREVDRRRDQVIVVRGWLQGNDVWVRVLASDGARRQWVVVGVRQACQLVETLLEQLNEPTSGADEPLTK